LTTEFTSEATYQGPIPLTLALDEPTDVHCYWTRIEKPQRAVVIISSDINEYLWD